MTVKTIAEAESVFGGGCYDIFGIYNDFNTSVTAKNS